MKRKHLFVIIVCIIILLTNYLIAADQIPSLQLLQSLDEYRVELLPKFMKYLTGNKTVIFDGNSYESMSEAIDLPFNFIYLGQTYKQIKVSNAGFITFNVSDYSTWDSFEENDLGSIDPKNALAPFWDELSLIYNSKIHYKTIGSEPDRSFIIEFLNMNWGVFDVSLLNFQIYLYEGSNDIEFHYGVMENLSDTDDFFVEGASIGIKDDQGNFINAMDGSGEIAQNNIKEPPVNNFRFTLSPIPTNDIGAYDIVALPHTIRVSDSISISLKVKNYGTANQSDYSISYRINNESPVTENFKTSLLAGSISTIVFETQWIPKIEGLNYLTAWSSLTNDQNMKNDTLGTQKEIDVKNQEVLFVEDFENYPVGPLTNVTESPWVQLEQGRNGNVSNTWVHSGNKNFEINSFLYNIETHYVKFDIKHKPSQLNVELWYTPDGYYIYTDFAEIGLGYVTSKFDMEAIAGYWGSDHNVYFRATGMENSVLVFNELEYARGPASLGLGTPKHNYIRSEFDFTNNEVRFYIGTSSEAPLRSTINFNGKLNFNALYIAGGLNETYIDDIYVEAKGQYVDTKVNDDITLIPSSYYLSRNYPNPFNPKTSIAFGLPKSDHVIIELINSLGQKIDVIVNSDLPAGKHIVEWNGENYSSGIYYYRLRTGSFVCTKKLLLLK